MRPTLMSAAAMRRINRTLVVAMVAAMVALGLAASAAAQDLQGTLKKVKDTGTLTLGYRENSPPFSFMSSLDRRFPVGYSVDLCQRVATAVQAKLGLANLQVNWVPVTVADRAAAVTSGRIDLECGSTSITLGRQEQVDFSNMTWVDGAGLLVRSGQNLASLSDMGGRRLAVIPGTTTEKALTEALRKKTVSAQIVPVKDHDEGRDALLAGKVDGYVSDRVLLIGLLMTSKEPAKLVLADEQFSYEPYGLMLRRGDAPFRLLINRTLATLYRSDEIVRVYDTWFGAIGRPSSVLVLMYVLNALPE
jgi:ABC-type amino acid transport substrate-binding protein